MIILACIIELYEKDYNIYIGWTFIHASGLCAIRLVRG